jgi:two-component system, chemotaxis family, chemotaxis protein CheV
MTTPLHDADERTNLTGNNKFELMLFRLGEAPGSDRRELFGINVFKVREILVMPTITAMANAPPMCSGWPTSAGRSFP